MDWAERIGRRIRLRDLHILLAVAECGSMSKASTRLAMSQPVVSKTISDLEHSLGVRLFDRGRGKRTVALTEAGQLLLRHVEPIAERLQAARADLLAYAAGETGTLRVSTYQSVGARALPAIISRFGQAWPGIDVRLTEVLSDEGGLGLVASGAADVAFGVLPLPSGPFDSRELLRDPFVLVARADSPLARLSGPPSIEMIADQKLIGFRSCRSTRWTEERLREAGRDPEFVFRSEDNGIVQAMAAAGLGVALVPLLAVDATDPSVCVVLTDLEPRRIAIVWHRDRYRSPATQAFIEIASQVCSDLARELVLGPSQV